MSETNTLAVVAVLMSALSLIISSFSVWPSWKDHLATIRDAILWMALVFVIVGAANYAWRTSEFRQGLQKSRLPQERWQSPQVGPLPQGAIASDTTLEAHAAW